MKNYVKGFNRFINESEEHSSSKKVTINVDEETSISISDIRRIIKMDPNQEIELTGAVDTIASGLYGDIPSRKDNTYTAGEIIEWLNAIGYSEKDTELFDEFLAKVYLSTSMSGEFATVIFNGKEELIEEEESLRKTWQKILDVANSMGADGAYSVEDDQIITQSEIDKLDDSPNEF